MATAKKHALQIFRAALEAADPHRAVGENLRFDGRTLTCAGRRYRTDRFERVFVIGAGKASAAMAAAVERILGRRIAGGVVCAPEGVTDRLRRVRLRSASHPLPDERGVAAAREITEVARQAGERDLVIAVISGGASSLLPAPVPPLTLREKQELTQQMLLAGATIQELNTVRKHLSMIKGGRLAELVYPARMIALVLSDVIGDDLAVIGSGPTVGDPTTVADARTVLEKYGLQGPELHETPKPGDVRLSHVQNVIVGSNRLALDAAASKARDLGYRVLILSSFVDGEAREIARMHAAIAREILANGRPVRAPACILSGGETTVTVRGNGKGGRNLEFVLAAAMALEGEKRVTIFSAGTDGIDGPTDAAGAIADASTLVRAEKLGCHPQAFLDNNDSYDFFKAADGLVKTGPTGTNVMDVRLFLVDQKG